MSFWRLPARLRGRVRMSASTTTRLSGRWLLLARLVWMVLVLFVLGVTIAGLPATFAVLHQPCTFNNASCNGNGLLTASQMQALAQSGFSLDAHAWSYLGVSGVYALVSIVLGALIFWRKSDDWMALLVALQCIGGGASITGPLGYSSSSWVVLENAAAAYSGLGAV